MKQHDVKSEYAVANQCLDLNLVQNQSPTKTPRPNLQVAKSSGQLRLKGVTSTTAQHGPGSSRLESKPIFDRYPLVGVSYGQGESTGQLLGIT